LCWTRFGSFWQLGFAIQKSGFGWTRLAGFRWRCRKAPVLSFEMDSFLDPNGPIWAKQQKKAGELIPIEYERGRIRLK
jgi:hypothetical protein